MLNTCSYSRRDGHLKVEGLWAYKVPRFPRKTAPCEVIRVLESPPEFATRVLEMGGGRGELLIESSQTDFI